MVAMDAAGQVIRPAKLWNDTESAPDAGWLIKQLDRGATAWAEACGSVPVAAFTVTKLSWLHRSEPEHWARLARVLLPHDWLTWRLTGAFTTDRGDASGTGYWSPDEGAYRWDLLRIVDGERDWFTVVPEVLGPLDDAAGLARRGRRPGDGRQHGGRAGPRACGRGDVVVSLGTSGTVYAVSEQPTADATGAVAGFADATGRYLPLVCTLNATKVTDAVAGLLGVDHDGLDALAANAAPGAGGLTLLPYLDGERTPNRPGASGVLAGLRSDVSRAQLARAAFEGVACGLLDAYDALGALAPTGGRLLLTGGGARSTTYRQVLADLTGRVRRRCRRSTRRWPRAPASRPRPCSCSRSRPRWPRPGGSTRARSSSRAPGEAAAADVRAAYGARRDLEA